MIEELAFWSAVTLYGAATVAFFVWAAFRKDLAARVGTWLGAGALAPHALAILLRWRDVGHGPYNTRYEVFSADAFLAVALWLGASAAVRALRGLGAFVMPLVFLLLGLGFETFGVRRDVPIIFKSWWLVLHVAFAKLFFAAVVVAAACAAAYLVKRRRADALRMLPPVERLDLFGHQFMLLSFLCLGVMIAAGSLWAHQSWGRYWAWDPIETASLVNWLALGAILHFRVLHGWSGRRMAWLSIVGLGFALVTLYLVVLIVPTIHDSYLVGQ